MVQIYLKVLTLIAALSVFIIGKVCFHLKDDNQAEEIAEMVIKDQTGMDLDLTPNSPEQVDIKDSQSKL